jgi:hypothetical protein
MASTPTSTPLTRVEQTYQQLRHDVPQLGQFPSVLIQIIAEYGPPSLWIVYPSPFMPHRCYALYPAAVIETLSMNNNAGASSRKRSPARNRPSSTSRASGDGKTTSLEWSNGWQELSIYLQPPSSREATKDMKYKDWFDDWTVGYSVNQYVVIHLPHDQPVTKAWAFRLPPAAQIEGHQRLDASNCIWRSDTG